MPAKNRTMRRLVSQVDIQVFERHVQEANAFRHPLKPLDVGRRIFHRM